MMTYAIEYFWILISYNTLYQSILKWTGNLFVGGAVIIFSIAPEIGFEPSLLAMFLVGHIIWSVMALAIKEYELLALNVFFCLMDTYGFFIRL